jgi:hypothetical protein
MMTGWRLSVSVIAINGVAIPRIEGQKFSDFVANESLRESDARVKAPHGSLERERAGVREISQPFIPTPTPMGFSTNTCLPALIARMAIGT